MSTRTFRQGRGFFRRLLQILRRPGGADVLERHLDAADLESQPVQAPTYCTECGSTDFEPTGMRDEQGRLRVSRFRCRA